LNCISVTPHPLLRPASESQAVQSVKPLLHHMLLLVAAVAAVEAATAAIVMMS
jgi:hypothetical protein